MCQKQTHVYTYKIYYIFDNDYSSLVSKEKTSLLMY